MDPSDQPDQKLNEVNNDILNTWMRGNLGINVDIKRKKKRFDSVLRQKTL